MNTTPQAALLSEASKLSNEFQPTMHIDVLISWGNDAVAELRRLDALVAHLTADRDDTANELALRTKHNIALTNERDLLAKLQATQELVQAGSASLLDGCKSIMDSIAVSSSVIEHNKQAEPVQAGELPEMPEPAHRGPTGTGTYFNSFTADQMHAYARAALSARKPLPAQDRRKLWAEHEEVAATFEVFDRVVTLTERAHGIGGNHADKA